MLIVVSVQIRYIFRDVAVLRFDEPQDVQVHLENFHKFPFKTAYHNYLKLTCT